METRQSVRKRRNSSVSNSRSSSPVSHRTRQSMSGQFEQTAPSLAPKRAVSTPKKSRKRVRFSDPGPRLLDHDVCSTGLTPAMQRTSFVAGFPGSGDRTPSRKARRRSAPTPHFRRCFDPVEPFDETSSERVVQFTPLRQILDTRTQRRIKRIGLSDELNHIQREKREVATFEKTLAALLRERDALQQELACMKQVRDIPGDQLPSYESFWMSSQFRARGVEEQTTLLCDDVSVASHPSLNGRVSSVENDGDTFMLNDSAIIASSSPVFRSRRTIRSPSPERQSLFDGPDYDVTALTPVNDGPDDTDMHTLTIDLETARNEKRDLFDACRSQMSALENSELAEILRKPSPPPDFFENILTTLTAALSRASDATKTLEGISQECSSLGFSGPNMDYVLSDIKSNFRSARLELERAIPGETAGAALGDGKATLRALVKRVKSLAKELQSERKYHHGSLGRERALRRQFDNLLHRYEAAADKIGSLEDSIASSAGDMLHTRMRLQDLESEDQEKTVGIDRLNTALDKYHEDVKGLEDLVSKMEDENVAIKSKYRAQISALREQVAHECKQRSIAELCTSEHEARIRQLEETVARNRTRTSDLTAQIDALDKEHQNALREKTQDQQQHAQETGTLNVRISELATSLDAARSEAHRLRQVNTGLEEQLQIELEARDELLDQWATEQARSFAHMKETVSSERRRAKVRAANWELKSDDLMSDGTTIAGSEPITPVSMTRFVDVEMGRGKVRRRMDSGVGIITGDELLESEDVSDNDLPTPNLIGL
ncbi:uncharacterized protein N7484_003209 [Penicillium longicatenatum]|uniref:uncharacterized protein n=1 Tax=Penicillium longicatenatum TaxID=1561947 RepID=UPI0025496A95|nr:uncharacterized protein N7484_003209 [Penicillium longicatenatum]KAJ5649486.1 hypothetical protein N7484_003209 [Penicillium longicatenatum]